MRRIELLALSFVTAIILVGCNSGSNDRRVFQPSLNLCEEVSPEELTNLTYADTLAWEDDTATINWYLPRINKIVAEIESSCRDKDHRVFPFQKFDKVIYHQANSISGTELSESQTKEFMRIINNPTHFTWGETTFEANEKVIFEYKGKEIAQMKAMDMSVIKSTPENPLMKFGALNSEGKSKLKALLEK